MGWGYFALVYDRGSIILRTLRPEGILRKLQKVMKLTQKWKDCENNDRDHMTT
jgi:hypothetical protein